MAANFGDTIMEGGIEPSVRVQAPVEAPAPDRSSEVLANGLAPVFGTLGAMAGTIFKQSQEDASAKILGNYENDLLDLADAVDQDAITSDEAMLQARALHRKYLSNAPALQGEFGKVWSSFAGASGMGHVVVEGTVEEKAREAAHTEAIKLGYSDEEYSLFQARSREAAALTQQVEILTARGQVPTLQQKNKYINVVIGLAESAFPAAQTQINNAMAAIAANPNSKPEVAAQLNLSLGQSVEQLRAMAGPIDASYITTPIEGLMKTFNDWTNDTISTTVLENEIKATKLKYEAMYTNDPVLGPVIAASAILGDLGLANTSVANAMFNDEFLRRLKTATEGKPVNVVGGEEGDVLFTEGIKTVSGTITPDSAPELVEEVMGTLNSMVDGAYTFERVAAEDGLGYKGLVETLGSPETANAIKVGGGITAQHSDKFVGVLKENYENVLLPAIQQYWESVPVQTPTAGERVTPSNLPMSELIKPIWNGSGVEFVPKEGYEGDPRIVSLANDANTGSASIGVPLNSLINAYANVTQEDAKAIWERDFAGRLFNLGPDGEPTVASQVNSVLDATAKTPEAVAPLGEEQLFNTNASDLTLEDFNPDPEEAARIIQDAVKQTQADDPVAVVNAKNPIEFAQAFIGTSEKDSEGVQVLSSFIQKAAGIAINPAQTAWCAAFVDAVLHSTGQGAGTGKLNAQSYLNWGKPVSTPQVGDVVVFSRGAAGSGLGHVGFYAGMNLDGTIKVLGGNQSDEVNFSNYDAARVLGYRRANNG